MSLTASAWTIRLRAPPACARGCARSRACGANCSSSRWRCWSGCVLMPLLIWVAGNRVLGPYTHGQNLHAGALALLGDFFIGPGARLGGVLGGGPWAGRAAPAAAPVRAPVWALARSRGRCSPASPRPVGPDGKGEHGRGGRMRREAPGAQRAAPRRGSRRRPAENNPKTPIALSSAPCSGAKRASCGRQEQDHDPGQQQPNRQGDG